MAKTPKKVKKKVPASVIKERKKATRKRVTEKRAMSPEERGQHQASVFGAYADEDMGKRFKKYAQQGRKPKYTSAPQMEKVIIEYFDECYERKAPATITGLSLALGISSQQFKRYEHKTEKFRSLLKSARDMVEHFYEELLIGGKGSTPGVIFALKQLDWSDKHEVEMTGQVMIIAADEEDL